MPLATTAKTTVWGLNTKQLAGTAMLSALAAVFEIVPLDLRIPSPFGRVSIDPTGIPIALAAILYGPAAGVLATGVMGIVLGARNFPGAAFKVPAELATAVPLVLVLYGLRRQLHGPPSVRRVAVGTAFGVAVGTRILVMTPVILALVPLFYGTPAAAVQQSLPFFAFLNLVQGLLNVAAAYLIVTRLPQDLKPAWLLGGGT